jgi:hypothetical protein
MLRASLEKVVHTVKRAGTYAAKVPPQELNKIAVHVRAVAIVSLCFILIVLLSVCQVDALPKLAFSGAGD